MSTSLVSTGVQFPDSTIQTTAAGAGGLTLVSTTTASSSSSVAFTGLSSTAYAYYQLVGEAILPSGGVTSMYMRVSTDNGSTYLSDNTYRYNGVTSNDTAPGANRGYNTDAFNLGALYQNTTNGCCILNLFPNASGSYFNVSGSSVGSDYFGYQTGATLLGVYTGSTTPVNAIRLYLNSGTISGVFRLYGVSL